MVNNVGVISVEIELNSCWFTTDVGRQISASDDLKTRQYISMSKLTSPMFNAYLCYMLLKRWRITQTII